jgi:hypothetical protein
MLAEFPSRDLLSAFFSPDPVTGMDYLKKSYLLLCFFSFLAV